MDIIERDNETSRVYILRMIACSEICFLTALYRNVVTASPAGSICTTSTDMIQYLKFLLSKSSVHDGLVSKEIILDTFKPSNYFDRQPTIHMPQFPVYHAMHTYGMGWSQGVYRGNRS